MVHNFPNLMKNINLHQPLLCKTDLDPTAMQWGPFLSFILNPAVYHISQRASTQKKAHDRYSSKSGRGALKSSAILWNLSASMPSLRLG